MPAYITIFQYAVAAAGTVLFALCLVLSVRSGIKYFKEPEEALVCRESNLRIFARSLLYVLLLKLALTILGAVVTGKGFGMEAAYAWNRWDAPHYIDIAKDGYVATGENSVFIAFFPLFPLLMKAMSFLTGEYFIAGSIVSMLCFAGALFYVYKLVFRDYGAKTARRSQILMVLFPTAFFATIAYTEGLFLLLTAAFMYYLRQRRLWAAAVLGFFAALTRSVGVMLVFPFGVQVLLDALHEGGGARKIIWRIVRRGWKVILIPLGTVVYLLINYAVFGDALHFLVAQREHWSQGMCFIGYTLRVLTNCVFTRDIRLVLELFLPELIAIFVVLWLLLGAARRKNSVMMAQALPLYYMSVSVTWLLSAPRYMLPVLVIYPEMALRAKSRGAFAVVCVLMAAAGIVLAGVFVGGGNVY